MNRIYLLLILNLSLISFKSHAQETIEEKPVKVQLPGVKMDGNFRNRNIAVQSETGRISINYAIGQKFIHYLLDSSAQLIKSFEYPFAKEYDFSLTKCLQLDYA